MTCSRARTSATESAGSSEESGELDMGGECGSPLTTRLQRLPARHAGDVSDARFGSAGRTKSHVSAHRDCSRVPGAARLRRPEVTMTHSHEEHSYDAPSF